MLLRHALRQLPAAVAATAALTSVALIAPSSTGSAASAAPSTLGSPPRPPAQSALASPVLTAQSVALIRAAVLRTAASLRGRPYRYGAAGPRAFDCSGYVTYVFRRRGVRLPRTAQQQYRAAHKISKSRIRPGDLVFIVSGGYAYHVGIYAGHGRIWHSPHSGQTVRLTKIWTSHWVAGRIL